MNLQKHVQIYTQTHTQKGTQNARLAKDGKMHTTWRIVPTPEASPAEPEVAWLCVAS